MGLLRQEYCSELLFPYPGDLPNSGIKPGSPALQADSLLTELQGKPAGLISFKKEMDTTLLAFPLFPILGLDRRTHILPVLGGAMV